MTADHDLVRARRLFEEARTEPAPVLTAVEEMPVLAPTGDERERLRVRGEELVARGEVAVLTVAGGEGTRLGFDQPKGCYPISPVRGASLYQLFAEGLVAARRRSGARVPWLLVTSEATDHATRSHLAGFSPWLGADADPGFRTIRQGQLPVLGEHGELLLGESGRPITAPDGHGGAFTALLQSGALAELEEAGIRHIFYHHVDNPLGMRPDPVMLAAHVEARAQVSAKVVPKTDPAEKVGILVRIGGRTRVLEYSELSQGTQNERRPDGTLRLDAGSIGVHVFDVEFLSEVATREDPLPVHLAHKAVPHLDQKGRLVTPEKPNAYKLETFIFDLLPLAERTLALRVPRQGEFHPLKDSEGEYSPPRVQEELVLWWRSWLLQQGIPHDSGRPVEVSPLLARHPGELVSPYTVEDCPQGQFLGPGESEGSWLMAEENDTN